jgi:predicted PolB exonuclease-like 3'-5' exonuclease
MNVFLDIETIPEQPEAESRAQIAEGISAPSVMSKQETIDAWHNGEGKYAGAKDEAIEIEYRKTALDGGRGEVISIAWAVNDQPVRMVNRELGGCESTLINAFFQQLKNELAVTGKGRPPFFIGHRITFDLKFLFRRCVVLGIHPEFRLNFRGRHASDYFCNAEAWCEFREYISQDSLCKVLGIEGKPGDIDGSKVWDFVKRGNIDRVSEYNIDDVEKSRLIYNRLNFLERAAS